VHVNVTKHFISTSKTIATKPSYTRPRPQLSRGRGWDQFLGLEAEAGTKT